MKKDWMSKPGTIRFVIYKSGYLNENDRYTDCIRLSAHLSELSALRALGKLDPDYHYVERQEFVKIARGFYDWQTDETYGFMQRGNYFGNEITEEMLEAAS